MNLEVNTKGTGDISKNGGPPKMLPKAMRILSKLPESTFLDVRHEQRITLLPSVCW